MVGATGGFRLRSRPARRCVLHGRHYVSHPRRCACHAAPNCGSPPPALRSPCRTFCLWTWPIPRIDPDLKQLRKARAPRVRPSSAITDLWRCWQWPGKLVSVRPTGFPPPNSPSVTLPIDRMVSARQAQRNCWSQLPSRPPCFSSATKDPRYTSISPRFSFRGFHAPRSPQLRSCLGAPSAPIPCGRAATPAAINVLDSAVFFRYNLPVRAPCSSRCSE